jgi:hypothetical protein
MFNEMNTICLVCLLAYTISLWILIREINKPVYRRSNDE